MCRPLNVQAASVQNTQTNCSRWLNILWPTNNPRAPHLLNCCHWVQPNRKRALQCATGHKNASDAHSPTHPIAQWKRNVRSSSWTIIKAEAACAVVPSHISGLIIHLLFDIIPWRTLTSLLHRAEPHAVSSCHSHGVNYIYVTDSVWFGRLEGQSR